MSAYKRLKAFAHWIKLEQNPSEDREMHAEDIEKLLAVVDAAIALDEENIYIDKVKHPNQYNLRIAIKEVGRSELGMCVQI